ncbi:MAG: hypothetical protein CMH64_04205 [Nanoarchaeota archaeon]|nr:hypothetical protein [Nanoarchaeota archaeon]|tara:strand:+ start:1181 stop:1759 length:579 start_codon:yes stop_codon:yes gene_type:complete
MKKLTILFLIFIVLLSSSVYASKSIPLDFESKERYIVPLYKGDRVFFEFNDDNHTIILDEIRSNRVEFDMFIYQNDAKESGNSNLIYSSLDTYRTLRLDLDRDNIHDFEIRMSDFDDAKAILEFSKISKPKPGVEIVDLLEDDKEDVEDEVVVREAFYKDPRFLIGLGVIALIFVLISIIDRYVRGKKETYF